MSRQISNKTKEIRKMGIGQGKDYKPYITTSEFNSQGTTSVINDWKTGRAIHCLSQGEMLWYYILRWDDNNADIREQFPLNRNLTLKIAKENGFKPPGQRDHIMTTDFLVTEIDGSLHAYSVKSNDNLSQRELQILCIEKIYWSKQGVPFDILFKTKANKTLVANIRLITEFFNPQNVFDKYSAIKHKISIKEYHIDLEHKILTNTDLDKLLEANN